MDKLSIGIFEEMMALSYKKRNFEKNFFEIFEGNLNCTALHFLSSMGGLISPTK